MQGISAMRGSQFWLLVPDLSDGLIKFSLMQGKSAMRGSGPGRVGLEEWASAAWYHLLLRRISSVFSGVLCAFGYVCFRHQLHIHIAEVLIKHLHGVWAGDSQPA